VLRLSGLEGRNAGDGDGPGRIRHIGGLGLFEELHGVGGIAEVVSADYSQAAFALFERLPITPVLSGIAVALVFIFLVTSADSATFVLGMLTSDGDMDPPRRAKLTSILLADPSRWEVYVARLHAMIEGDDAYEPIADRPRVVQRAST